MGKVFVALSEKILAMAGVLGRCLLPALLAPGSSGSRGGALSKEAMRVLILCRGGRGMSTGAASEAEKAAVRQQLEAAAREDRLDLFTAAKILFSTPPKPKTFGLDFHLWQFFVACLPPFAVYLTAQYARYEMRRMEKERDEAEQLKQQAALAEHLAVQSADEESKPVNLSSTLKPPGSDSPGMQQENKDNSEIKSKDDSVVILAEKDLLAMKARLDAMEEKVKLLESVRPGATFIIPIGSDPDAPKKSEEENLQRTAAQMADNAEVGKDHHRKPEKQTNDTPLDGENQKDLQVPLNSGRRSWFGTRSKANERDLSD